MSTLIDYKNALYEHFLNNDYFNIKTDSSKILIVENELSDKEGCLMAAMKEFEKAGIAYPISEDNNKWVISQKLDSYDKTIKITAETAVGIKKVFDALKESGYSNKDIDIMNIKDEDIRVLVVCAANLFEKKNEE